MSLQKTITFLAFHCLLKIYLFVIPRFGLSLLPCHIHLLVDDLGFLSRFDVIYELCIDAPMSLNVATDVLVPQKFFVLFCVTLYIANEVDIFPCSIRRIILNYERVFGLFYGV